jgi:Fic family protein
MSCRVRIYYYTVILIFYGYSSKTFWKFKPGFRIMRLFLLNSANFDIAEIISRCRVTKANVRKELNALLSLGFIKQKYITKKEFEVERKKL